MKTNLLMNNINKFQTHKTKCINCNFILEKLIYTKIKVQEPELLLFLLHTF